MHPRQAALLAQAREITEKLTDKQAATPVLWKYVDEAGLEFFLPSRRQTIHSPYSGKSCPQRPERYQIPAIGKELQQEQKTAPAPGAPGPKAGSPKNKRKQADDGTWTVVVEE
jgi:hypothetical protein